jgi:hypothetical protein
VPRHFDHVTASLPFGIGTFCVGKLDDQLVRLDLDPDDVIVNEGCVLDLGRFVEVTSNTLYDESLDLQLRSRANEGSENRRAQRSIRRIFR